MDIETIRTRAREYCEHETDETFKAQVVDLLARDDRKELEDRFYRDLEFGTGGLRGVIGGGYNRMNPFVVGRATQGLATYLKKAKPGKQLAAVIAYDSRHYSDVFALETALVFAGNGIKAYLFSGLRPTPELSFAVRRLHADTGVVVTASHNPPQYNGYKAYWDDGAQVITPHDEGIIAEVNRVKEVVAIAEKDALARGLLVRIDREIDVPYQDMVRSRLFRPALIKERAKDLKVVYTPLHGTGAMHVEGVLGSLGLDVLTVPEQREPNGDFPTVEKPNPEEAPALKLAVELGRKVKADVVMATDPDADRLGIAIPDGKGDFTLVTGNQLGSLLLDYVLLSRKELGKMPKKPATVRSIVTTDLQRRIAEGYGATSFECLTGFKWIADLARQFETNGEGYEYVYGSEESYGYLVETEVRDKDGVSAAAMTAEMTLYWRSKGKSLQDRLGDIYAMHGYYEEIGISRYFEGSSGVEIIKGIMAKLRSSPPSTLGGVKVTRIRDIANGTSWNTDNPGRKEKVDLPSSNVLQFYLADGSIVSARPSGTEPKVKFYASCRNEITGSLDEAKSRVKAELAAIDRDLQGILNVR